MLVPGTALTRDPGKSGQCRFVTACKDHSTCRLQSLSPDFPVQPTSITSAHQMGSGHRAGISIFTSREQGLWALGLTNRLCRPDRVFKRRLGSHEVWPSAKAQFGANYVLARVNGVDEARLAEERDLIARYTPPLNTHYQPTPLNGLCAPPAPEAGISGLGPLAHRGTREAGS